MYGIFTYIYHKNQLNVVNYIYIFKYTIYGSYGYIPFLGDVRKYALVEKLKRLHRSISRRSLH